MRGYLMPENERNFTEFLNGLNEKELKKLLSQLKPHIKKLEKENSKKVAMEVAIKLRDRLKIGSDVHYEVKGEVFTGKVEGIFQDKIKVAIDGKSKHVKILNLVSKENTGK